MRMWNALLAIDTGYSYTNYDDEYLLQILDFVAEKLEQCSKEEKIGSNEEIDISSLRTMHC